MRRFATIAAAGGLLASASAFPSFPILRRYENQTTTENSTQPATPQGFADIPVTKDLQWIPCFDKYMCTNLEVPLDYQDPSVGTTSIAWIKLTGGDGTGPDILHNPGGPGGSGIDAVRTFGAKYLEVFGGNYNIISWDPRGVNNSGPYLTCFPEDAQSRGKYTIGAGAALTIPLSERFQRAKAMGERCSAVNEHTEAKYAGTSAVVQDMKYFIELLATARGENPEEASLWYYGVSYGTIIGQTFAQMFPEKVGRMILDGNVYGVGHYNGEVTSALDDTDEAVRSFFTYCYEAGPEKCKYAGNATSADEIETKYRELLQLLDEEPLVVSDANQPLPDVVTRPALETFVFNQAYQPMIQFRNLDAVLAGLENGNATMLKLVQSLSGAVQGDLPNPDYMMSEATALVTCIDVNSRWNLTSIKQYEDLAQELKMISYYGGGPMSLQNAVACVGNAIAPPESQLFPGFQEVATKSPILFVNTLRDPVTPLSSAEKNSKFFKGSVVLAQDTSGHGFVGVPSSCTNGHVQAYLADLTLPPVNTICEGDVKPLVDAPSQEQRKLKMRSIY